MNAFWFILGIFVGTFLGIFIFGIVVLPGIEEEERMMERRKKSNGEREEM